MTRSGSSELFPGTDPARITDTSFLIALAALDVPYYLKKQRYSQFCIETNRRPDWPAFYRYMPRPVWNR